ncbi:MAG TPA: PAS domain S-box protein [Candidatus Krumholzibacteria bacterium]
MHYTVFNRTEILIVDDHEAIRSGIRFLLESKPQWHVCGEAVDGVDAVEKVKTLHPDVVLMDISMPRMDGITAMRIVQHEAPRSRVIIVTQNDAISLRKESVNADGYVLKVHLHRDLVPAIERVLGSWHDDAATVPPAPAAVAPQERVADYLQPQSTGLLAAIVDSSDEAIISKDLDGIIMSWNASAERVFGYSAEEMLGRSILRLVPPERRHEEQEIIERIKRGERVPLFETVRLRKDGCAVAVTMTVSPVKAADGTVIGASNQSRDITGRLRSERDAALLSSIVSHSEDAIVSKNLDGIVTSWNAGAERLFGYRPDEMIGQSITKIIPRDRHAEEEGILARLRRGEVVDHFETVRQRRDGSTVDVSVTISPLRDARGRIIGASKIARDITHRKLEDRSLRASEQRLRGINDDLEATVSEGTRELERRNAEILEQSQQLQELSFRLQQGQDEERRRIARELHDSAGQLLAVLGMNLGRLRDSIHGDSGATGALDSSEKILEQLNSEIRTLSYLLHPPLLDESGLSGAVQWYARGLSERGGFDIQLDIPRDFGRLPSDMEVALFRIVQECLTNIHRHSSSKTAAIHLSCDGQQVRLDVEDQGHGIPPETLSHLHTHRTGVGLAGIRERVRHFGGELHIDSNDHGTRVSVTLPLQPRVTDDARARS